MKYQKLLYFLQNAGKDPSVLIFEDELTGLHNRRFFLNYIKTGVNWKNTDRSPFSLIMMDIDYFKRVNDLYGHDIGDQVLIHVAKILKKISSGHGIPVRYAGDEFVLLLPDKNKAAALSIGARLVQIIQENHFLPPGGGDPIEITVSLGVATAPDDGADGRVLLTQADTAMYSAKQSGRNIYADAGAVKREVVFPKLAVHYLESAGIAGRRTQMEAVSTALRKVGEGQSRFLIIDGASGMGKTSLLNSVFCNLEKTSLSPIRIAGMVQESYRPYYLMAYLAIALMNQREDNGLEILSRMDERKIALLAGIIPQLSSQDIILGKSGPEDRKALFNAFTEFLIKLVGNRPLVLLIDDLQYADPASLHLIRFIFKQQAILMFICATAAIDEGAGAGTIPLELFRTAYGRELGIQSIPLTPLSEQDIEVHLNNIFPGISIPRGMTKQIVRATEGNPFFIVQLMRKMVEDGKIVQDRKRWSMKRVTRSYFPGSIDEIIDQRMADLDENSRRFLHRASAFGESTSLSMLVGSGKEKSGEAHDFLNHVLDKGIVRSEFDENDENVRFSSKQVHNRIYENISLKDKKRLHNIIGRYQEKLYQQDLIHSPAFLAYHFRRSDDTAKADNYEQIQDAWNRDIFNQNEIPAYTGEDGAEGETIREEVDGLGDEIADTPISGDSMNRIPGLLRVLLISIRNTMLYPESSKSVQDAVTQFMHRLNPILENEERFSIIVDKKNILVNGFPVEISDIQSVSDKIISLWRGLELKSLTFIRGVSEDEVRKLLKRIATVERKTIAPGFWERFTEESEMTSLIPRQIRYRKISPDTDESADRPAVDIPAPPGTGTGESGFDKTMLFRIQRVISAFLGAVSKLKLYPATGPVARKAMNQVLTELRGIFETRPALSIARVDDRLLFDGVKVEMQGFETLENGLVKFLKAAQINSLTFVKTLQTDELVSFLSAFSNRPDGKLGSDYWRSVAKDKQIKSILFDYGMYGVMDAIPGSGLHAKPDGMKDGLKRQKQESSVAAKDGGMDVSAGSGTIPAPAEGEGDFSGRAPETELQKQDEKPLENRLRDSFLKGDEKTAEALLEDLFTAYGNADIPGKKAILDRFETLLSPKEWKPGLKYMRMVCDRLYRIMEAETDATLLGRAADLLYSVSEKFILFSDYDWATRILSGIRGKAPIPGGKANILSQRAAEAVMEDFAAGDGEKQQAAYQLLSSMGQAALPLLAELIRRVDRLKIRQLAAELIASIGPEGETFIRSALMEETRPDYRARILDVIDSITTGLTAELTFALSDTSDVVLRSAFRLAERIATPEVLNILIRFARGDDEKTALFAVSSLGKIGKPEAIDTLIHVLENSPSPEVQMAACRAMGRMADPAFLTPLVSVLLSKRRAIFKKKYGVPVRVAAAYAVSKIPDQRAVTILQGLSDDPDPRIRESARQILAGMADTNP